MRITFLGTGTSHGIPVLGCSCSVCSSADPRDTRWRSSALVEGDQGEVLLLDAGPEFRLQALRACITRLDAVFITHTHADHVHGLDDIRPLSRKSALPVHAGRADCEELRARFSYAFGGGQEGGGKPRIGLSELGTLPVRVGGLRVQPVPLLHGERPVLGYRIGGLAYLTDCSAVPPASMELLAGLDLLVVDALRERPHPTHLSVGQALELAARLSPGRLLLTHLCHDLSHAGLELRCASAGLPFPAGPAHDGLRVELPGRPAA